jgi:predicted  nucleic acid-binding Zn-ribbon protein
MMKFAAIASLGFVAASETSVNPIRKVVTLMQEMQKEVEAEGATEKDLFEKFMCYCKGNNEALKTQGADAAASGEALRSKQESETGEKKQVDQDLKQAKTDRAEAKKDLEKATALRNKDAAAYAAENADALANLDATEKAISALEKGMGASFLQSASGSALKTVIAKLADSMLSDSSDKEVMASFLEASGDYIPASGQIVGILKNMKDEMEKDIGTAKTEEDAAVKAFGELKAAKNKEIAATTEAVESLTKRSGELAVSIIENKNAAEDAEEEAADAAEFLTNLKKNCADKQAEYDENMATRAQEVEAISQAIAILNEDDALDLFKKTLKTGKTVVTTVEFLQKSSKKASNLTRAKALIASMSVKSDIKVALLQNTLKGMLSMGKVDFSKVLKMIDEMVALLVKEQKDDESSKAYCEKEFDSSDDTKKALTGELKALSSSISEMKDEIESLSTQIAETKDKIAALDKSVAEASAQRKSENAEFTAATAANNMAIELIGKAKNKLMQFYNPDLAITEEAPKKSMGDMLADGSFNDNQMTQAAAVPAFVQMHSSMRMRAAQPGPAPETATYSSKAQGSSTITALMDKLSEELKTGNLNMSNEEKTAQRDYEQLLADADKSKKEDTKSMMDKSSAKANSEESLGEAKRTHSLKTTAFEENATYIADLHKSCDFIVAKFEERREARTNEVEGLKKAKAVLSGADYSFLF